MSQLKIVWLATLVATFMIMHDGKQLAGEPAPGQTAGSAEAGGVVTGKVLFKGTAPKHDPLVMEKDPYCVDAHYGQQVYAEDGAVNSDGTLPNVFVYVKEGAEKQTFPVPKQPVTLDQIGCVYVPHVLGIMVGQELRVVSSDLTTHNTHPLPKGNREWNLSQAPGGPPVTRKFAHPEIMIPVYCNKHPWMKAYIGVTANPFYAVTGSDGTFTIKGMPPGDYTIAAWTATSGTQQQRVTVKSRESATMNFTFTAP